MSATSDKVVFVTGTDTGVGKTVVSAVITRELLRRGIAARPLKLFSSGGRDDAEMLRRAAGGRWTIDEINPFAFEAPLTPLLAAEAEGREILLEEALRTIESAGDDCDLLIVEGAGGLMSPLGPGYDAVDLIRESNAKSVLVAMDRLGVLNQVLLAVRVMETAGLAPAGVVLNQSGPVDRSRAGNLNLLHRLRPGMPLEPLREVEPERPCEPGVIFLQKTLAALTGRT